MNLEPNPPPPLLPTTLLLSTCNLHPDEQHPGFCASCLRERLAGLESSSSISTATTSHRKIINASALKSIFRTSNNNNSSNKAAAAAAAAASSSSSFLPELRRCKSFSGRKAEGFSGAFEPQRKSCDVRARNTLWFLFNKDNNERKNKEICEEEEIEVEVVETTVPNSGLLRVVGDPVFEETRDEVEEEEERNGEEIRVSNVNVSEVVQVIEEEEITMKDHIDHDSTNNNNNNKKPSGRDLKEIAGSFWGAASVFSKKLQKWRRKQKMKKSGTGTSSLSRMQQQQQQHNKPQSEIADYGYGRRSCDVDPRYSLDAGRMSLDAGRMSLDTGRMSFDDPRYSWDEPRASWDGYLIGRTFPRLAPMVSVVEDLPPPPAPAPAPPVPVIITRSDHQIPVEEPLNSSSNDDTTPGGSVQTRDYYSDSSQRRRKSFERSTSMRKKAAAVGADVVVVVEEDHENKPPGSNAKVSPAATIDQLPGPKLIGTDRDSKSNSLLRDDRSESFESAFRDSASISGGLDHRKDLKKSSSRWSKAWNIWGLIHKRNVGGGGGGGKEDEEERYNNNSNSNSRGNVVERSYSESWQDLRRDVNGELRRDHVVNVEAAAKGGGGGGGFNRVFRSNSSVSSRHSSFNTATQFGATSSMRSSNAETNGHGKKRKEEVVLERSRSARYSPNDVDNGLLRFYLTPLRNRRNGSVKNNNSKPPKNTYSIARSVLRLY